MICFAKTLPLLVLDLFEPHISTGKALRIMHTQRRTALRTGPFFVFVFNEFHYADRLYAFQIFQYACSIFGSITLIQMIEAFARELIAVETILKLPLDQIFAVFYPAIYT
jgi:hypothetical protein